MRGLITRTLANDNHVNNHLMESLAFVYYGSIVNNRLKNDFLKNVKSSYHSSFLLPRVNIYYEYSLEVAFSWNLSICCLYMLFHYIIWRNEGNFRDIQVQYKCSIESKRLWSKVKNAVLKTSPNNL